MNRLALFSATSAMIVGMLGCTFVPGGIYGDGDRLPGGEGIANFSANLTGAQEVPAVTTTASGTGTFSLDQDQQMLSFEVTALDFPGDVTVAHFHVGAQGVAGPIVFNLTSFMEVGESTVTINGSTNLSDWDVSDPLGELFNGDIYINIHTGDHSAGEIRGQLEVVDE